MPGIGHGGAFLSGLVKVDTEWWGCSGGCVGGQVLLLLCLQQPIPPPRPNRCYSINPQGDT